MKAICTVSMHLSSLTRSYQKDEVYDLSEKEIEELKKIKCLETRFESLEPVVEKPKKKE